MMLGVFCGHGRVSRRGVVNEGEAMKPTTTDDDAGDNGDDDGNGP